MPEAEESGGKNGANGTAALVKLVKQLDLPTLLAVVLMGGGNWFTTQKNSTDREQQIDQSIKQIHELHDALEETEKRQRKALDNQTEILEHDTVLLKEVHEIATKLERLKNLDQMRGAPQ
jgi:vacuolar-type H+-ATPase subunit I/STV1